MKAQDWITKALKDIGVYAEKSATGGYWINSDWDYESDGTWNLVSKEYAISLFKA